MYTFSILMNFVTMSVYWSVLHGPVLERNKNLPIVGPRRVIHLYTVHIIPGVVCLINSAMTNCILSTQFWKPIVYIGFFYSGCQFVYVKSTGDVMYPFLNFNDGPWTYISICGIVVVSVTFYLIFCYIDG